MRRRYGVICFFFIAFFLTAVMCYGSHRYAQHEQNKRNELKKSTQTNSKKKQIVTSDTKYIVEKYDEEDESIVKEEQAIPPEYIGLTRSQLERLLAEEMAMAPREEEEKGLNHISLESFSREKIVVRKTYMEKEESGFMLKVLDGEVAIYNRDGTKLYEKTGLREENLSPEDRKMMEKGCTVKNEKELYSILENFSS